VRNPFRNADIVVAMIDSLLAKGKVLDKFRAEAMRLRDRWAARTVAPTRQDRDAEISRLRQAGVTTKNIAHRYGLSASRVRRIVRGVRP
jgi:DNA-binding NarL/FixJ family response regulator